MKLESCVGGSLAGLELLDSSHPAISVSRGSQCRPQTIFQIVFISIVVWRHSIPDRLTCFPPGSQFGKDGRDLLEMGPEVLLRGRTSCLLCFLFLVAHTCHSAVASCHCLPLHSRLHPLKLWTQMNASSSLHLLLVKRKSSKITKSTFSYFLLVIFY